MIFFLQIIIGSLKIIKECKECLQKYYCCCNGRFEYIQPFFDSLPKFDYIIFEGSNGKKVNIRISVKSRLEYKKFNIPEYKNNAINNFNLKLVKIESYKKLSNLNLVDCTIENMHLIRRFVIRNNKGLSPVYVKFNNKVSILRSIPSCFFMKDIGVKENGGKMKCSWKCVNPQPLEFINTNFRLIKIIICRLPIIFLQSNELLEIEIFTPNITIPTLAVVYENEENIEIKEEPNGEVNLTNYGVEI